MSGGSISLKERVRELMNTWVGKTSQYLDPERSFRMSYALVADALKMPKRNPVRLTSADHDLLRRLRSPLSVPTPATTRGKLKPKAGSRRAR